MKKIAVEQSLENVKDYLRNRGYDVTDIESTQSNAKDFDAMVVSGQNSNFLGMHDTNTKAFVINAKGMSVEDIHKELNNRLS
ncbi:YkuS family protein [Clostridiaceae bacterium 35-E11]